MQLNRAYVPLGGEWKGVLVLMCIGDMSELAAAKSRFDNAFEGDISRQLI